MFTPFTSKRPYLAPARVGVHLLSSPPISGFELPICHHQAKLQPHFINPGPLSWTRRKLRAYLGFFLLDRVVGEPRAPALNKLWPVKLKGWISSILKYSVMAGWVVHAPLLQQMQGALVLTKRASVLPSWPCVVQQPPSTFTCLDIRQLCLAAFQRGGS